MAFIQKHLTELIGKSVCALCGNGVHIDDHEGRVACNGCNHATDNCTCLGDDLDNRHASTSR